MAGILEGIRIIDMGHFVAVPSGGVMLADWGAEVIKVEPLTGDPQRGIGRPASSPGFLHYDGGYLSWRMELHNRNKKAIAVDLKNDSGKDILYQLVKKSDAFMSNYEVSAIKELKMDYATLRQFNPGLVYAVLTGFGRVGPDKEQRGFDFVASWARAGMQYMTGEPGSIPPVQRPGINDRVAGSHVVAGILAALLHKERTGEGQELEFSLYHSAVWTMAADIQAALLGQPIPKHDRTNPQNPLINSYLAKDGRWFQLAMLRFELHWHDFCQAIGRPNLENDPRFSNMETVQKNCGELVRILDELFATRNLDDWEKRFIEHNCIYSRIQTPEEVTRDPQALANNFFAEIEHPKLGPLKLVTTPVKFCQNPASIRTPGPELGQHTEEVLLDIGYSRSDIAQFRDRGVIL